MKYFMRSLLFLLLAGGAMVFAGGGLEDPTGGAGIQVDKKAKGEKVDGVISVELYSNPFDGGSPTGRVILRLEYKKKVATFYTEIPPGTDTATPVLVQSVVTDQLKQKILEEFFGGNSSLEIKLKSVDNVSSLGLPPDQAIATSLTCGLTIDPAALDSTDTLDPTQCPTAGSNIIVMDVELAVGKPKQH